MSEHTTNPNAGSETVAQKGRRLGGYFSWNVLEVILNMGIMPIVLVPICRHIAGRETVGLFIYVLGIVSLVGDVRAWSPRARGTGLRTSFHDGWCMEIDERKSLLPNDRPLLRGFVPLWLRLKPRRIDTRQGEFK